MEKLKLHAAEEHIVNQYSPSGSRAYVGVDLVLSNGTATVSRRGDRQRSVLEVQADDLELTGNDAEEWLRSKVMSGGSVGTDQNVSEGDFRRSFLTAALLQQDDVRAFLSGSSPSERFETLSQMLGLAVLGEFVEALAGTESRLGDILKQRSQEFEAAKSSVENDRRSLDEAQARISAAPSVQDADRRYHAEQDRLGVHLREIAPDDDPIRYYESLLATTVDWQSSLRVLESTFIAIRNHLETRPTESLQSLDRRHQEVVETVTGFIEARDVAIEALTQAEATWVVAQARGDALEALASAAIPLLTDFCPVCTQAIEEPSVRQRLEQILSANPDLSHAAQAYHGTREHTDSLRIQTTEAEQLLQAVERQRNSAIVWESELDSLLAEARGNASSVESLHPQIPTENSDTREVQLPRAFESWFIETQSRVQQIQAVVRTEIAAHQALQEGLRVGNLESRLSARVASLSDADASVKSAQAALTARHDMVDRARHQSTRVVEETFTELEPVVQDVFARLSPHPTFDTLSFSHEVFRRRGTSVPIAHDRMIGTSINPALIFSSAQANVAALCYFIGLAFASSESDFGFVLMDDPLQSMDDVNVLGFSDLCRFLRKEKQVIVSSHEARLTNLLRRKLSPRNEPLHTVVIDFVSWNRSGPLINVEKIGPAQEMAVLGQHMC